MANSNVRFYKLATLPTFEEKHKGIFVHVTSKLIRTIKEGAYSYSWGELNPGEIQKIVIQKIVERETTKSVLVPEWMDLRRIDTVESGLWFGGENGWELLSNDTTDAAINAAIATLDVDGYAQATISGSTLTISGIKEDNGIIAKDDNNKLEVAIDGGYDKTDNKIATQLTVKNAIEALDANTVQAVTFNTPENGGNTTLTFKGVQETNGVIAQGDGAETFIVGDAKLKIQIGSATTDVFSANAKSDSTIKLDGNVFKKNGDVISVITKTDVASNNKLVTEQDIASLGGAMHYKGPLTGAQSGDGSWPSTVAAGDVYIVTTGFTHSGESNPFEVGDMIVFNTDNNNSNYTVVQSNLTLGTGIGQVAANSAALASGNLVVATDNGIKTTDISASVLGEANNTRDLTYSNVTGGITITDSLKIMNRDFNESINITSTNRSIKIAATASENATNVVLDLVWNTIME